MSDLRTRIAAVIEAHDPCGLPGGIDCSCGQGFRPDSGSWVERGVEANRLWSEHLADAVIRELNLDISTTYKTSQGREVCIEGFWTDWTDDAN